MNYNFEMTEQPAQPVLMIRKRTTAADLPRELGAAYEAIIRYLGEISEQPAGPAFAAYYNMDMEDLDVGMGFLVAKQLPGQGEIAATEIPGGKQVSCLFKGPYRQMEGPYNAMTQWLAENEHQPTGIAYEFYYNSPHEVPENELLTKIMFPLK